MKLMVKKKMEDDPDLVYVPKPLITVITATYGSSALFNHFGNSKFLPWLKKIIWLIGVLRRTVAWEWRFDNLWRSHFHLTSTLKMASALVVETSVANNSPSQDFNYPDDVFQSRYVTPGFKAFFYSTFPITSALAFAFEAFVSRLKRLMFLCDR